VGHPLEGCWAKIARANEQLEALEADIAGTPVNTDAIAFAQKFDPDASTIEVTLEGVPKLPLELGLAAAEPMQNLRAAINYLAWELAKWNLAQRGETREPDGRTQFPINTKPCEFSAHRVRDIHSHHVAIIKALQPNGANWLSQFPEHVLREGDAEGLAKAHPLAVLADLSNIDKHQALQPALVGPRQFQLGPYEGIDCVVGECRSTLNLTLENGAHWVTCDVTPTGPEPKMKVEDRVSAEKIEFGGGDMEHLKWVASSVREIVRRVRASLLGSAVPIIRR
jgi:hypothetical protein